MHNGNLKCLRTKNGRALWANMDARSPSHLSRSRESLLDSLTCVVCRKGGLCVGAGTSAPVGARLSARTEWLGDAAAVQK